MFVVLKHVYIPLLFFSGVDYIDAPTPYMMGLYSGVDTSTLAMDGVSYLIHTCVFNLLVGPFVCCHFLVFITLCSSLRWQCFFPFLSHQKQSN